MSGLEVLSHGGRAGGGGGAAAGAARVEASGANGGRVEEVGELDKVNEAVLVGVAGVEEAREHTIVDREVLVTTDAAQLLLADAARAVAVGGEEGLAQATMVRVVVHAQLLHGVVGKTLQKRRVHGRPAHGR